MTTVQFVDSVASSPTVRLDLNTGEWGLTYQGTEIGTPPLDRAVADTLLADGAIYPASAYGNRVLTLSLKLVTSTVDELANEMQKLFRELDRATNILKWQPPTSTHPVFFRTFRSDARHVEEVPGNNLAKIITCEVMAEPFAVGLKETGSAVAVSNDPAAGSNGCFLDVTSVKGDVETPAILSASTTNLVATNEHQSLFAVRRRGTPSSTPFLVQAEALTSSTDTSSQPNDAAMSGGGNNFKRTTFGTPSMTTRMHGTHPASASVANRGLYRVMMKYRKSVSGDVIKVRLRWGGDAVTITNDTVTLPTGTDIRYADLGYMAMPAGPDPVTDGLSGTELSVNGSYIEVQAERTSGSGNLDVDYLLFVPADDRLCLIKWGSVAGADNYIVDASRDMVYQTTTAGAVRNANIAQLVGGLPMLSPNQTNRIYFIRQVKSDGTTDSIASTNSWTVSYYPRYVYVRPAST